MSAKPIAVLFILLLAGVGFTSTAKAQRVPVSVDTAIAMALKNNLQLKSSNLAVTQSKAMQKTAFDPGKTAFTVSQDPTGGGSNDNSISVSQSFAWPGLYKNQKKVLAGQTGLAERSGNYTRSEITRDTRLAYYNLLYSINTLKVLDLQDSIYRNFIKKSEVRYKVGETSNLELITARNKYQEVQALKKAAETELAIQQLNLQQLLNVNTTIIPQENMLPILTLADAGTTGSSNNPLIDVYQQQIAVAKAKIDLERSRTLPDLTLGYSQQFVIKSFDPANIGRGYTPGTRIAGIQLGVAVPLFNGAGRARINNEKIAVQIAETDYQRIQNQLNMQYQQELKNYAQHKTIVDYFTSGGLKQADEQIRIAQVSYDLGEIGYIEFIQNMALAVQSKLNYLQTVNQLNQSVIQLQFLKGN